MSIGPNANGTYWRFPNGFQRTITEGFAVPALANNSYVDYVPPASFARGRTAGGYITGTNLASSIQGDTLKLSIMNGAPTYRIINLSGAAMGNPVSVNIVMEGRWC